eukprot:3078575-Rhodomonas_salina.4
MTKRELGTDAGSQGTVLADPRWTIQGTVPGRLGVQFDSYRQTQIDTDKNTRHTQHKMHESPEGTLPGPFRVQFGAQAVPGESRGWRGS